MTTSAGRWQSLGALLIQRRTALDPRFHNRNTFAEATGLSYRLIYDIEEGRRTNFGSSTLAALEAAYQLDPGAIRQFLDGGEFYQAEPAGASVTRLPVGGQRPRWRPEVREGTLIDAATNVRAERHLPAIRAAVDAALQKNPDPDGRLVFPRAPDLAGQWDAAREATDPDHPDALEVAVWLVALHMARRDAEAGQNPAAGR